MMALPLVPHALGVVIHALAAEQVRVEPGISLFFVLQALQHELQVRFGKRYCLLVRDAFWLASELNDLASWWMWGVGFITPSDGQRNGALAVALSTACWTQWRELRR